MKVVSGRLATEIIATAHDKIDFLISDLAIIDEKLDELLKRKTKRFRRHDIRPRSVKINARRRSTIQ